MKSFEEIAQAGYAKLQKHINEGQAKHPSPEGGVRDWHELSPTTREGFVEFTRQVSAELALVH